MQNQPDELTEAVRDGPNGLFVVQAQHQTTVQDFENAALAFDGSIGTEIEGAAHVTVALGRACATVHACALFFSRTCPDPGGSFLADSKVFCLGSHFGNDLVRRIDTVNPAYGLCWNADDLTSSLWRGHFTQDREPRPVAQLHAGARGADWQSPGPIDSICCSTNCNSWRVKLINRR
jgi:hypothetical protein